MIHNVKGVIVIDGIPAPEVVAAAVRNGWVRFPITWNAEGEVMGLPIDRSVMKPMNGPEPKSE